MPSSFVSFGRMHLDLFLGGISFSGKVLDIGGKKINKRGRFCPPLDQVELWQYANLDAATGPDFLCGADRIPVADAGYDWVILTEVLEHVPDPSLVLAECARVLKAGGTLVLSMPFLFPVHADPSDFRRWTPQMLSRELERYGFRVEEIRSRGGLASVIWDLIGFYSYQPRPSFWGKVSGRVFIALVPLVGWIDRRLQGNEGVTTGYCVLAFKSTVGRSVTKVAQTE